jgi:flagellar basal-body rod modification protein FlgD
MTVTSATNDAGNSALIASLNGSGTSTTTSATQEISDRFLKLLTTQLKNQDPTNPLDNAELTSQLAQLSTVEGITKLNTTLSELSRTSQMLQGASLVGHSVLAEGNNIELTDSGGVGGIDLASKADSVKVSILDEDGKTIREMQLGEQDGGLVRFVWDGKNTAGELQSNGTFSFKATATAAGTAVDATTYSLGSVVSVALNSSDAMVAEVSGVGTLTLDKIRQVY